MHKKRTRTHVGKLAVDRRPRRRLRRPEILGFCIKFISSDCPSPNTLLSAKVFITEGVLGLFPCFCTTSYIRSDKCGIIQRRYQSVYNFCKGFWLKISFSICFSIYRKVDQVNGGLYHLLFSFCTAPYILSYFCPSTRLSCVPTSVLMSTSLLRFP